MKNMKRTFLAMVMAGSSIAMFAQTTPVNPANPTTPTSPSTPVTTSPTTSSVTSTPITTNSVTNSTTDPMNTTTNQQVNVTTNTSNWNNAASNATYPQSTSWMPGTSPYWGWNSYSIWDNSNAAATSGTATTNGSATTSGTSGTAVTSLPYFVQTNFGKEYPNPSNNQYTWNQYGDWFSTYYTGKGRLTQYFYGQRGNGYSLSLPVVQTYVPEEVIDKALQKYGAHLYSIGMVKTADGNNSYQIGLLNHGQLHNEYLNEEGVSVANIWRTEEMNMSSTSANTAMDTQGATSTDLNSASKDMNVSADTTGKPKMKSTTTNADGTKTITKTKNGRTKTKTKGHKNGMDSTSTSSGMKEQ